ncbi:helix-turn-helix domain-containing protein [Aerococcus viridans]
MNRKVYSADVLEKYILMFIKDGINYPTLVKEYGLSIHNTIFYQYVNKYRKYGLEALKPRKLNNIYSEEFKLNTALGIVHQCGTFVHCMRAKSPPSAKIIVQLYNLLYTYFMYEFSYK